MSHACLNRSRSKFAGTAACRVRPSSKANKSPAAGQGGQGGTAPPKRGRKSNQAHYQAAMQAALERDQVRIVPATNRHLRNTLEKQCRYFQVRRRSAEASSADSPDILEEVLEPVADPDPLRMDLNEALRHDPVLNWGCTDDEYDSSPSVREHHKAEAKERLALDRRRRTFAKNLQAQWEVSCRHAVFPSGSAVQIYCHFCAGLPRSQRGWTQHQRRRHDLGRQRRRDHLHTASCVTRLDAQQGYLWGEQGEHQRRHRVNTSLR